MGDIFVYNHIDDDNEFYSAILEGMSDRPFNVHEMSKKVFVPFETNDEFDTPLTEIDPDMQFFWKVITSKIQSVIIALKTHLLKTFPKSRNRRGHYQCFI